MDEVKEYVTWRSLPRDLALRVKKYYSHYYTRRPAFDEVSLLDGLPPSLNTEVTKYVLKETLGRLPLFAQQLDHDFQLEVFPLIKPVSYAKNEVIFKRGEPSRDLLFLLSGEVEVLDPMTVHAHAHAHAHAHGTSPPLPLVRRGRRPRPHDRSGHGQDHPDRGDRHLRHRPAQARECLVCMCMCMPRSPRPRRSPSPPPTRRGACVLTAHPTSIPDDVHVARGQRMHMRMPSVRRACTCTLPQAPL